METKKLLQLSWRRVGLIILGWFAAVILHNAIYGIFGVEEAVFFIVAVFILPIYFIIALIYTVFQKFKSKQPPPQSQ